MAHTRVSPSRCYDTRWLQYEVRTDPNNSLTLLVKRSYSDRNLAGLLLEANWFQFYNLSTFHFAPVKFAPKSGAKPTFSTSLTPRHRQLLEEDNHIIRFAGAEILNAIIRRDKLDIGESPDGWLVGDD